MTKEEKAINDQKDMFFGLLDQIYKTCEVAAKSFNTTVISLNFLEMTHKKVKQSFNEGLKKALKK